MSRLERLQRSSFAPREADAHEKALMAGLHERERYPLQQYQTGHYAPNPSFIRFVRFLLHLLASGSAIVTAALGLAVVNWYFTHKPAIYPAWGSMVAVIIFGLATPFILFGTMLFLPWFPFFRRPFSVMNIITQTKLEIIIMFSLAIIWFCGALAQAADLRGDEFCLWDGYFHFKKPADFPHVCKLVNVAVALGYTTFGIIFAECCFLFLVVVYIYLFLDQEVLTEPANDIGGRAYRARTAALSERYERERFRSLNSDPSRFGGSGYDVNYGPGPMTGGTPSLPLSKVDRNGQVIQTWNANGQPMHPQPHGAYAQPASRQSPTNSSYSGSQASVEENATLLRKDPHTRVAESDDEEELPDEAYYGH